MKTTIDEWSNQFSNPDSDNKTKSRGLFLDRSTPEFLARAERRMRAMRRLGLKPPKDEFEEQALAERSSYLIKSLREQYRAPNSGLDKI